MQGGAGETLEISSYAVKFRATTVIEDTATEIRVSIPWPVSLDDGAKLQLVVTGTPIWQGPDFEGIRIVKYEFRTRHCAASVDTIPTWSLPQSSSEPHETRYSPIPGNPGHPTPIAPVSAR